MAPQTTIQPNAPTQVRGVSFAPVRGGSNVVSSLASSLAPGISAYGKQLAAKEEQIAQSRKDKAMSDIVAQATDFASKEIDSISEGTTVSQAKINTAKYVNKLLTSSNIPVKDWGKVNAQINNITSDLGSEHYITRENQTFVANPDGSVRTLYLPGVDKAESSFETLLSQAPKEQRGYLQTLYAEDPAAGEKALRYSLEHSFLASQATQSTAILNEHVKNLDLDTKRLESAFPQNKTALNTSISQLATPLRRSLMESLQETQIDPDMSYGYFESSLRNIIFDPEFQSKIYSSGYKSASELWADYQPYLNSVKEEMKINSQVGSRDMATKEQQKQLEQARVKVALEDVAQQDSLSPQTRLVANNPNFVQNLMMTNALVNTMASNEKFRKSFPDVVDKFQLEKRSEDNIAEYKRQESIAPNNQQNFTHRVREFAEMTRQFRDPDLSVGEMKEMSPRYYLFLGEQLLESPLWEALESSEKNGDNARTLRKYFEDIKERSQ